ncbi:MAG: hypothetical protein GY910_07890 [bacterium]|nr:hypothetical protein [bacterium]
MLLTLVDPNRGSEIAYNRWYERDHFYAGCMVGPWLFSGSRWVATRELKDLRISDGRGEVANPVDAGSYVAIYWVQAGKGEEHWKWAGEQVHWLYSNGRGFLERTHVHTVLFDYLATAYRDDDPVPIQLALDHGYPGIAMIATERASGVSQQELLAWTAESGRFEGGAIASISSWCSRPRDEITGNAPMDLGTGTGGPERTMQLAFLEGRPRQAWDDVRYYAEAIDASGMGHVCFAGPFHKTVVGTNTYADQLW